MLRRILDYQLSLTDQGRRLQRLRPMIEATDTFLYEAPLNTRQAPHIRDAVDIKRWMIIVVFALLPCILMAIWNTGVQNVVYSSGDYQLMNEYLAGASSLDGYFDFAMKDNRYLSFIKEGPSPFFRL